jgi:hypothetical protein
MLTQEFVPDQHDPSIYIKMVKDHNGADAPLTVLFHVDDSLSSHPSEQVLVDFNNELMKAFPGTIKSSVTQFLGMTIRRSEDWSFWISQQPLIEKIYKQCEALAKIPELKARGWYLEPRVAGKDRDSNVPMLQDRLKRTTEPVTAAEQQVLKLFPYAEVLGACNRLRHDMHETDHFILIQGVVQIHIMLQTRPHRCSSGVGVLPSPQGA